VRSARLSAVCDIVEQRAISTASKWGAKTYYTDLDDMLRKERLQFLSVCTPPLTHTKIVCSAMDSGVNVVSEKPLAMTVKEVEQIAETARRGTSKLTMICNMLYKPAVARARSLFTSLKQEPTYVEVSFLKRPDDPLSADRSHWCHKLPGGAFAEVLIHAIYLARSFVGDLPVRGIHTDKLGELDWMRYDELNVFTASSEKMADIHLSFNSPQYHAIIDLYGRDNAVRADLNTNDVFLLRDRHKRFARKGAEALKQATTALENAVRIFPEALVFHMNRYQTPHEVCIRAFVDSIANGTPPPVSFEDLHSLIRTQETITTLIDEHKRS
jgi:predicted dehydrogenase